MTREHDEEELEYEDASSFGEAFPYALRMEQGNVVVFNADEFVETFGALILQVTDDGSVFYLTRDGEWKSFPVAGVKSNKKPNLKPV